MKKEDLLLEIKCALNDCFVAKVEEVQSESLIRLRFLDGRSFVLRLEEESAE